MTYRAFEAADPDLCILVSSRVSLLPEQRAAALRS